MPNDLHTELTQHPSNRIHPLPFRETTPPSQSSPAHDRSLHAPLPFDLVRFCYTLDSSVLSHTRVIQAINLIHKNLREMYVSVCRDAGARN